MTVVGATLGRLRAATVLHASVAGAAAAGLLLVVGGGAGLSAGWVSAGAAVAWAAAVVDGLRRARRQTRRDAAEAIQRAAGGLDNLPVTAAELEGALAWVRAELKDEIRRQAAARLEPIKPGEVQPLARPVLLAVGATLAWVVLAATGAVSHRTESMGEGRATMTDGPVASGAITVTVTPPAYAGRPVETLQDPAEVRALEGSAIRIAVSAPAHRETLIATHTRFLVLAVDEGGERRERVLPIVVEPDRPPVVRITAPGADLRLPRAEGTLTIEVDATDDLALASLAVRYTHVTGSGEAFDFQDGEWPLQTVERTPDRWRGRVEVPLASLGLGDGDAVVYRAIARDRRPGADPSASETFLVEIGALGTATTAGAAIPEERDRMALSQQIVIARTERLHAARGTLGDADRLEQARGLAVEQRMVKAEFVFMTGGEVQDEVEEAAHSHELAEGRMENEGQRELLAAIREMSRAEARLNEGDTARALTFERAALAALQRAFDRRRYFLRTLSERARIDPTRRLTGARDTASPGRRRAAIDTPSPEMEAVRRALAALAVWAGSPEARSAAAAQAVAAVDPGDADLARAALALGSARTEGEREQAVAAVVAQLGRRAAVDLAAPPRAMGVPR
ncbi:MAG: DUF4175 family protein [Acidobacteriota bacterium]